MTYNQPANLPIFYRLNYNSRGQYPCKIRINLKILLAGWHIQFLCICLKYPSSKQVKYVLVYPLKWYALLMPYIHNQKKGAGTYDFLQQMHEYLRRGCGISYCFLECQHVLDVVFCGNQRINLTRQ